MKKIYIVSYAYDNNDDYERICFAEVVMVFDSKEKAEEFCINNSDKKTEYDRYLILHDRTIIIPDDDDMEIFVNEDDDDEYNALEILEMNVH
jgi:hypothetical protein